MRIARVLDSFRKWTRKPRVRRVLLTVAATGFIAATWLALRNLPEDLGPIGWGSLALAASLVIPIAWLLGLEFAEIARIAGHAMTSLEAFRVAMMASASNLLPFPGAVVVKTGALVSAGRTAKSAFGSNALVAILWVGVAFLVGAPFAFAGSQWLGVSSLIAGLGLSAAGAIALTRVMANPNATILRVAAVEIGLTVAATARVWFVMRGIGVEPTLTASVWLVVVSVLSTVVGLFPAGLGLREALSAAVAPIVGLDPSVAVLVSAVDRVVRLGVLSVCAAAVAVLWPPSSSD